MAADLARDHRVVALTIPALANTFSAIPGVDVRVYRSSDVLGAAPPRAPLSDTEVLARATAIEAALGLRVFKAASNYLLYGRVVRQFGGRWDYLQTSREILRAYVEAYDCLVQLFDDEQPDVVFFEAVDLISNFVALALSLQRGVFAFDLRPSPLGEGKGGLGFGLERRNIILEHLYRNRHLIQAHYLVAAENLLAEPRKYIYDTFWTRTHRAMVSGQAPLNAKRVIAALRNPARALDTGNLRWNYRAFRNRQWLAKHLHTDNPNRPYVGFLLSHMPEASTCSQAPRWVNAEAIVEQLAVNAPAGLRIVVKEHPRTYGRRGRSFFGHLERLPNVTVCHPSIDNFELLSGAEAVLTVTGSAGFEGILLGKRVGVLGRPFYSVYSGVRTLNYPEEIFDALADSTWRPEAMHSERVDFLGAYLQSLWDFGAGEGTNLYAESAGGGWASALRDTYAFVSRHQLTPSAFESGLEVIADHRSAVR